MKSLNMNAANEAISNPVNISMSESEFACLVEILNDYLHMKELDDFDPQAIDKMKAANIILSRIS